MPSNVAFEDIAPLGLVASVTTMDACPLLGKGHSVQYNLIHVISASKRLRYLSSLFGSPGRTLTLFDIKGQSLFDQRRIAPGS